MRGEPDGLVAPVESHFTYEEKKLVSALDELGTPLPDDFALRDPTGGRWSASPGGRPRPAS